MPSFLEKEKFSKHLLEWYFCFSTADTGIKSNWNAMISAACYGGGDYIDPYNSFILQSIEKKREIEKIFFKLSIKYQKCLFASFADVRFDPLIQSIFHKFTGATYSIASTAELTRLCRAISLSTASPQDKVRVSELRVKASLLYNHSVATFYDLYKTYD